MRYDVVDAFTETIFRGSPAGVCLVDKHLAKEALQQIAAENNLSETAFVTRHDDHYGLRWGILECADNGDRVLIAGKATLYPQGEFHIEQNPHRLPDAP